MTALPVASQQGVSRSKLARLTLAATCTLFTAGLLATPAPAHAAYGVIEDEGLAACINRSLGNGRDDAQAITSADLGALRLQFSCGDGPAIRSLAGFEGAIRTLSLTISGSMHELSTPDSMAALGSLPKLSRVVLSKVNVTEAGLSGLAPAPNLQDVEISKAPTLSGVSALAGKVSITRVSITDSAAFTDLTGLAALVRLKTLDLGYNTALTDLGPLKDLTALESLTIQGTSVADIGPISKLTSLSRLAASGAKVTSLAPLRDLINLREIWVDGNQLTSLAGLENIESLTRLWASNNPLSGGIEALSNKPNLERLHIRSTGTTSIAALAASTKLTHLDAVDNQIPSLLGLADDGEGTTFSMDGQNLSAPQQFVPRGAVSFRVDAEGQVSLRDGVTFPALYDPSTPATGPVPDPDLPLLRFTALKNATELDYRFKVGGGFNAFSGRVAMPIVWSDITSEPQLSGTVGAQLSHQVAVTPGFPVQLFSLGEGSPAWLTIDPATGVLSGTPTTGGETPVTVLAADRLGNTITQDIVLTVKAVSMQGSVIGIGADQNGNAGDTLAFTVIRTNADENPWTGEATVHVSTRDGSGVAGTDYVGLEKQLVWEANDTAPKTIKVETIAPKARAAASEMTFTVELSLPGANTELGERSASIGTIAVKATEEVAPPGGQNPPPTQPGGTPDPGKSGALVSTGQPDGVGFWLAGAGTLFLGGAGLLIARRIMRRNAS